jgi:spore maturation protein A
MLNYIWLALITIGILVAVGTDISDLSSNKYHNGEEVAVTIILLSPASGGFQTGMQYSCSVLISSAELNTRYGLAGISSIKLNGEFIPSEINSGALRISPDDQMPAPWKEIFQAQRNTNFLLGRFQRDNVNSAEIHGRLSFEPVKFAMMNTVTNDGVIKYAKTAVELAIGLIGIMALWLGIMKIAEQSGLVAKLGNMLKPITTRVFPDVPADHPAMGAMIMNISANMLGLSNAATPFGLKAMEELDKLNTKKGTATDAMCTFLVINTGNLQLIPATVIAIRAAAGSSNPAEIIGPVIVATFITLVIGVTTVKALAKLPVFKKQLMG